MAVQNPYVEYIKISRTDELGQDLTPTLEALTQIKLPFTNGVSKTYYPVSRTRYRDYFLFGLSKNQNSAPLAADKSTLSYEFTGSLTPGAIVGPAIEFGGSFLLYNSKNIFISSSIEDNLNFYNEVTEEYILETLPQKTINVRAKVIFTPPNIVFTAISFGIFIIPQGATDLTFDPPKTEFNGINGYNPYLYKLSTSYPQGAPNPSTEDFNVDIPIGHIPPGASIEIRAVGGGQNTPTTIFAGSEMYISSTPTIVGPTLETIPEPYLLSNFEGTDCDVLLNNVDQYPPNRFLQDLDYSGNPNIPVNFDQVLEGNAQRGTVPESYYTALSQTNIRYNGSKAQSSDINLFDPYAGTSSFGEPINIGNFGQSPSVTAEDNVIAEFEWAGGTSPEIPGGAQFRLSNRLFEVSSKELVKVVTPDQNVIEFGVKNTIQSGSLGGGGSFIRTISQSRGDYYTVLNNTFGPGKELVPFQYNSILNDELPSFAKVVDNTQWVPGVASFAGTSSYTLDQPSGGSPVGYGYGYWIAGTNYIIIQGQTNFTPLINTEITKLGSGYNTDTSILVNSADKNTGWVAEITYSLKTGNRWFITLIKNFEFPVTTQTATDRFTDVQNGSELNKLGVFEILGIVQGGTGQTQLTVDVTPISFPSNPSQPNILTIGTNLNLQRLENLGFLIWKSRSNYSGQFLTMDQRASGIGPGAIYSRYASETVRKNYEDITREYGSNKT
jgi:hypothetical protein